MRKLPIPLGRALLTTLILLSGWIAVFGWHRPYFNWAPWELAEYLVSHNKPAAECFDLISFEILSPTQGAQRTACVYEYASLALDPAACKLLMPDEYSLACLSAVAGKLFAGHPCTGTLGKDEVYCNKTYSLGEISIEHPQIEDCTLYPRPDLREWCHYDRTLRMADIHECDRIENQIVRDDCETAHAFKQKTASLCRVVQDEGRRTYCEMRVGAWLDYPQLRSSSYFGVSALTN